LTAHWDAFGIGVARDRDSIYNGALDNASGVSGLLALARVFARYPQRRSIAFVFTGAEEWGLLGAEAFVCGGPIPRSRIVANLNVDDGTELFGMKRDVAPLGVELSTLGEVVTRVAGRRGLRVSPDPSPAEGFFFRGDNFPFARVGIPTLSMALGLDADGRPRGWAKRRFDQYLDHQYHGPEDEYENVVVDLRGARQFAEFIRDVTVAIANAPERPAWLPGEFTREGAGTQNSGVCAP
jgi:Zn-dependent M28 family amino/carboxypeptidase